MNTDITRFRREYSNEAKNKASALTSQQDREEATLTRLNDMEMPEEVRNLRFTALTTSIQTRGENIEKLQQRVKDYLSGVLDTEIQTELNKQNNLRKTREEAVVKKRQDSKKEEEEKKVRLYDPKYKDDDRSIIRDANYYLKQHNKADETLPDYMRENLRTMPNNKGYIWRGCRFYGLLPPETDRWTGEVCMDVLFERCRGVMHIHEVDGYSHRIYTKQGKDPKQFLSEELRVKKAEKPKKW